jgi:hypothetical protein
MQRSKNEVLESLSLSITDNISIVDKLSNTSSPYKNDSYSTITKSKTNSKLNSNSSSDSDDDGNSNQIIDTRNKIKNDSRNHEKIIKMNSYNTLNTSKSLNKMKLFSLLNRNNIYNSSSSICDNTNSNIVIIYINDFEFSQPIITINLGNSILFKLRGYLFYICMYIFLISNFNNNIII